MNCSIKSIHYYPVKSLSFSSLKKAKIKKNLGILNDRLFAFTRNIDYENASLFEKFPKNRRLNNFLTLKNSPVLNQYKFTYEGDELTLFKGVTKIISISSNDNYNYSLICKKLIELEPELLKPIFLLKNENYPFFDTTHSDQINNTISLINLNSIKDLEINIKQTIEFERFRGNLYIDGIDPWHERTWINKIIKINKISFKIKDHIARCSATNLKPNTTNSTINLPLTLKKNFNHSDMGVYITPLEDGEISIDDKIIFYK